jgi:adenylylsulfate kinase-like enzyme
MSPLQIALIALSVISIIVVLVFVADRSQLFTKRNLVAALLVVVSILNIVSVISSAKKDKDQAGK